MQQDSFAKVNRGLRKGIRVYAVFGAAALVLGIVRFYLEYLLNPAFPVFWVYAYLGVGIVVEATLVWYVKYRSNPRILHFVATISSRLREADYAPWGTKRRGLLLLCDNGLLMTVSQNLVAFRHLLGTDGSLLSPALDQWPSVLRSYRGLKRRASLSSRRGDVWQKAELERVRGLIGSRSAFLSLYERASADAGEAAGKWNVVGLFFTSKWWQRGDAIRNAIDDIARLLQQFAKNPVP